MTVAHGAADAADMITASVTERVALGNGEVVVSGKVEQPFV
jgi:hypothetical protein